MIKKLILPLLLALLLAFAGPLNAVMVSSAASRRHADEDGTDDPSREGDAAAQSGDQAPHEFIIKGRPVPVAPPPPVPKPKPQPRPKPAATPIPTPVPTPTKPVTKPS